jgi:glycosyltransferase involved in cell wall biosynthesis
MRITIYCGHSFEEWSPKSESKGIGGSEEAVINLSRELVKLGNEVTVFNRCGDDEGTYDGVKYENYEYFKGECDVLIYWRQPHYVYQNKDKVKAKQTYLWLHDTVPQDDILPIKHFVDGIFVLSGFHASLYPALKDKLIRTSNGINSDHFNQKVTRNPYKIVYGSSYDRGLKELLEMWSEIKAFEPRAELSVFYGMSMIQDEHFKDEIIHLLKQEGITDLGRISHEEVAKEYLSAGVWCYPCWFPEISCITAMKAQTGGAIPVICPTAALQETVKWGLTTREPRDYKGELPWGTEMSSYLMDSYVELVKKALNPEYQKRIRPKMMKDVNFSWNIVAKGWDKLFKEGVKWKSGK